MSESFINHEKLEYLKRLNENEILSFLSEEKSDEIIFYGLSLLKDELKVHELSRLSSIELKSKLLKSVRSDCYKILGIEGLYNESCKRKIKEELLPKELAFGIEIEARGRKYQMFISNFEYKNWEIKEERTVNEGIEFASPKFHYIEKDMNEIDKVCNFLKDNDFFINQSCAGHLHYGYQYLENILALIILMFLYCSNEKELYLISNNEKSNIREPAKRNVLSFMSVIDAMEEFAEKSYYLNSFVIPTYLEVDRDRIIYKHYSLNINNITNRLKNTTEFRIPNGTLEYDDWNKNIILYGSIMKLAKKIASSKDNISNFYDHLFYNYNSEQRIEYFMNSLFDDEKLKNVYYKRFDAHQNDPMIKQLGLKEFKLSNFKALKALADKQ